jgi:two-component system phosphate regulon response regulator PhoB
MRKVVLVVDNDEDVRDSVVTALAHAGFDSLGARSARQALAFLDEIVPSAIVLDFLLGDMNGVDLAREIRSRAALAFTPLIMLTGAAGAAHERLLKSGLDVRVLSKPVETVALTNTIEDLFARLRPLDRPGSRGAIV